METTASGFERFRAVIDDCLSDSCNHGDSSPVSMSSETEREGPILPPKDQIMGMAEKRISKLLRAHGLEVRALHEEGFHVTIRNEPYIDLVIEAHDDDITPGLRSIYLTHYLECNGDRYIDSEMVFLANKEVGYLNLYGVTPCQMVSSRYMDRGPGSRSFASMFSLNLIQQGFASKEASVFSGSILENCRSAEPGGPAAG